MARPIPLELPKRDPREELRARLERAPAEHAEAVLAGFEVLQSLHDRGVLELVRGVLGGGDKILEIAVEATKTPEAIRGIRNLLILTEILGAIDPDVLAKCAEAVPDALAAAAKAHSEEAPGLRDTWRIFRSKSLRRGLAMINGVLEVWGSKCILLLAGGAVLTLSPSLMAQTADPRCPPNVSSSTQGCAQPDAATVAASSGSESAGQTGAPAMTGGSNQDDWVQRWLRTVDKARASQPHFVAPIVTSHVALVEQFRYDMGWQPDPVGGTVTSNYGASRGLEIIPTSRLEVAISPPPYLAHQSSVPDGYGDLSFQVKYRAFSAPEDQGDYFVGFFFAGSLPTGTQPNGLGHAVLSPTLAAAKGFGPFDVQSTIAVALPTSGTDVLGRTIVFNTAVDYRIKGIIWPMLEQNSTFWSGGALDGKKQVFLTPGVVLGGFPLAERLHVSVGAGVQIAVTQFRQYDHRWIVSARFPF
jgi:uncharacterized protein YjgD (DUF1641 family)